METLVQQEIQPERRNLASTFLRWSGAMILVASAIHYMLQGLNITSESLRFWIMPGFISFLSICGLLCGYWLKDAKNTRIFFGLGTAFVAAQLSQVAAMGRAFMIKGQAGELLLDMWWDLDRLSPLILGMNIGVSVLLAIPVAYAGFTILARQHRTSLLVGFMLANIAMVLPTREPIMITALILCGFALLRFRDIRLHQPDRAMHTVSGYSARLLVWIPLFILIGRSAFYPVSELQYAMLMGLVSWLMIKEIPRVVGKAEFIPLLQYFGMTLAIAAWFMGAHDFIESFASKTEVYIGLLPIVTFLFLVSFQVQDDSPATRFVAALIAMLTVVCVMLDRHDYVSALMSIATGIGLIVAGLHLHEKLVISCGAISFVGGLMYYMGFLLDIYHAMPWLSAGLLGVAALLLASWIEKQQGDMRGKIGSAWHVVKTW
ncbi:MAG: hypothetical protein V3V22_02765 [Methylococcales bacterium]